MELADAVETVKQAVRVQAVHLHWPMPGIKDKIREWDEAQANLLTIPKLELSSHPYYQSVDEGQSGFVIAAHLTDEQMLGVPLHIVHEVLDDLATCAGGANHDSPLDYRRGQVLEAYGAELAAIVCEAIDEALESKSEEYKRLTDWDGKKHAALDSTEIDEPRYEDCDPDAEHASPTTTFDFWEAIESARELIERRDKTAAAARRGELAPTPEAQAA